MRTFLNPEDRRQDVLPHRDGMRFASICNAGDQAVANGGAVGTMSFSSRKPLALGLLCLIVTFAGCALSGKPGPPPPILVAAYAAPPVGKVTPIFIEVVSPPAVPGVAHREDVCAFEPGGNCIRALDLEEAGRMAGGAEKLAAALTQDESAAGAIGRSVLSVSGQGLIASHEMASGLSDANLAAGVLMLGTAASLTVGIARGAYLTANPEARLLDEIAAYSLGSRVNLNWYPNHARGFVYFPTAEYSRIRVIVDTTKRKMPLWLEWPRGSEKTFDIRSTEPRAAAPESRPGSAGQPATAHRN